MHTHTHTQKNQVSSALSHNLPKSFQWLDTLNILFLPAVIIFFCFIPISLAFHRHTETHTNTLTRVGVYAFESNSKIWHLWGLKWICYSTMWYLWKLTPPLNPSPLLNVHICDGINIHSICHASTQIFFQTLAVFKTGIRNKFIVPYYYYDSLVPSISHPFLRVPWCIFDKIDRPTKSNPTKTEHTYQMCTCACVVWMNDSLSLSLALVPVSIAKHFPEMSYKMAMYILWHCGSLAVI